MHSHGNRTVEHVQVRDNLLIDVMAGVSIGFMVIPQGVAQQFPVAMFPSLVASPSCPTRLPSPSSLPLPIPSDLIADEQQSSAAMWWPTLHNMHTC